MARIPHAERAILDIRKIADYCLSSTHPRGRHKARVFREALGIGHGDAQWLREALLDGVRRVDAVELANDDIGDRWRVDVPIRRQDKLVVVRTVWIVRSGEEVPRFVTCWIL
jgi:hypothetical protein